MTSEKLSKIIVRIKRYTLFMVSIVIIVLWFAWLRSMVVVTFKQGFSVPGVFTIIIAWFISYPFIRLGVWCHNEYRRLGRLDSKEVLEKQRKSTIEATIKTAIVGGPIAIRKAANIFLLVICATTAFVLLMGALSNRIVMVFSASEVMYSDDAVRMIIALITSNIGIVTVTIGTVRSMLFDKSPGGDILAFVYIVGTVYTTTLYVSNWVGIVSGTYVPNTLVYGPLLVSLSMFSTYIIGVVMCGRHHYGEYSHDS